MKKVDELTKLAGLLKGLVVLGCQRDSPAARAGVRYGDILLSINGTPTPDWSSFVKARSQVERTMALVLFRDGAEFNVEVQLPERSGPPSMAKLLGELVEQRLLFPDAGDRADDEPS